jgi:hypothetical protein
MTFMPYNTNGGYCTLQDEGPPSTNDAPAPNVPRKQIRTKKPAYEDATRSQQAGGHSTHATTEDPIVHMADLFTTNFEARQNAMKQYKSWRNSNIQYKTE